MAGRGESPGGRTRLGPTGSRIAVFLAAFAVAVGTATVPRAIGHHVHRVSGYTHGVGDGKNDNDYVHPFIAGNGADYKVLSVFRSRSGSDYLRSNSCHCGHLHLNQDTSGIAPECRYYMWSSRPYGHRHYHHNWCG